MRACVCVCIYLYMDVFIICIAWLTLEALWTTRNPRCLWQETIPCHDLAEAFAITSRPERCVVPLSTLHQNSSIAKVMGRQWIGHLAALGRLELRLERPELCCATYCVVLCDAHDMLAIFRHDMDVKSLEVQMYILYIHAVLQYSNTITFLTL